jgi:hypothetical protein
MDPLNTTAGRDVGSVLNVVQVHDREAARGRTKGIGAAIE